MYRKGLEFDPRWSVTHPHRDKFPISAPFLSTFSITFTCHQHQFLVFLALPFLLICRPIVNCGISTDRGRLIVGVSSSVQALCNMAVLASSRGKIKEAGEIFAQAMSQRPDSRDVRTLVKSFAHGKGFHTTLVWLTTNRNLRRFCTIMQSSDWKSATTRNALDSYWKRLVCVHPCSGPFASAEIGNAVGRPGRWWKKTPISALRFIVWHRP